MNAIYLLIPISLIFLGIAIAAFLWAAKSRQFDDMDTPAMSILLDDVKPSTSNTKPNENISRNSEQA